MVSVRSKLVVLMVALFALLALPAFAQDAEIPQITVELTGDGIAVSGDVPEGVVNVTFDNNSAGAFTPVFARFNEGATIDDFMGAMEQDIFGALALVSLLGGVDVQAGLETTATFDFTPGDYILLDFASQSMQHVLFTVADAEGDGAADPEADVTVRLFDFAFSLPLELSAGEQTWLIENQGMQWHELGIARIDPAVSVEDYQALLQQMATGEAPEGEAESGAEPVFFWMPMNQGERAWVTLDLEPGTYVIACFVPDVLGELTGEPGHAHAELGMVNIITVQ